MSQFADILRKHKADFHPIFPFDLHRMKICYLNLSVDNPELENYDILSLNGLQTYIDASLKKSNADICIGGYLEDRLIYRKSQHFGNDENARSIHLGIDIWSPAGTLLFAPFDSRVHSFQINDNFGDYGPTIILQHNIEGQTFHSLYGHLSKDSLEGLEQGMPISKGEQFASLGSENENGNWPPHLHFQIIRDMENKLGDYPGVCSKIEKEKFQANCPNPEVFYL